jgi:hypothetical protein
MKGKKMRTSTRILLTCALLLVGASFSFAQTQITKPRKFKTTYKITMYAEATFRSAKVTDIPANVVLEALEETERYGGYIKVTYKNRTGWVLKAETHRYMDVPAPVLACWSNGYKIIGNIYRYFFVLRNDGTFPYDGKVTLRLFDGEGKTVFERVVDFSDDPLKAEAGGPFNIDTLVEAPQFELEHRDGKIKAGTGKFIERLP